MKLFYIHYNITILQYKSLLFLNYSNNLELLKALSNNSRRFKCNNAIFWKVIIKKLQKIIAEKSSTIKTTLKGH